MNVLREIAPDEFARRLFQQSEKSDTRFALFLGAGCSVTSGIPCASTLVSEHWLPRLHKLRSPQTDFASWTKTEFPNYDQNDAAAIYGRVINALLLQPADRQREIEALCDGRFPGFGYAVLASLVALEGGHFNVVLTTNFDDLVADALYLFTNSRPLVILHESLASYIRPTRTRALIVKMHGDNRLSPQNTEAETSVLKVAIDKQVQALLHDRALIFFGYGGNDLGIKCMLEKLPEEALPGGVFWVGSEPKGALRLWLESRSAVWVHSKDFDRSMLLIRDAFSLPQPDSKRFDTVYKKYFDTYQSLSNEIASLPDEANVTALKTAVRHSDRQFSDWWAVELAADRVSKSSLDEAEKIYRDGIKLFPTASPLLGNFAVLLQTRSKFDDAEDMFKQAIAADPQNAINIGNYANFLGSKRNDQDGAEVQYAKAIEVDPKNAVNLGNYAFFLSHVRNNGEKADEYFKRAMSADSCTPQIIVLYANFLSQRSEFNRADDMFKKAVASEPKDIDILTNYAVFLHTKLNDIERADEYFRRAVLADQRNLNALANYAGFYLAHFNPAHGINVLEPLLDQELPDVTAVECWFYALVHGGAKWRQKAFQNLKTSILAGKRSPKWDFSSNLAKAEADRNPDLPWLKILASVIAQDGDVSLLNDWDEWERTAV